MAQQCFHRFCFSLSCSISSHAFLRLRLRLPAGNTPSSTQSPGRHKGLTVAARWKHRQIPTKVWDQALAKPPRVPAVTSRPALPSTGTGFWFGPAAGFCFNVQDLEKIPHHHHNKQRKRKEFFLKSWFSPLCFPFPEAQEFAQGANDRKICPCTYKRQVHELPWEKGTAEGRVMLH